MEYLRAREGFTLVEITIILLVLAVLAAMLVPSIGGFNRLARFIRVKNDLRILCPMMKFALDDMAEGTFWIHGTFNVNTPRRTVQDPVGLLIGDGDIPDEAGILGGQNWRLAIDEDFSETTDGPNPVTVTFAVDTFANHLIQNSPFDDRTRRYRTPADMIDGSSSSRVAGGLIFDPVAGETFNSLFAWRGPYLNDRVVPDPWGNRYMSNTFALYRPQFAGVVASEGEGFTSAVVCYSAGPDEEVDTVFNQPFGWFTGDDDFTVVLAAGGI